MSDPKMPSNEAETKNLSGDAQTRQEGGGGTAPTMRSSTQETNLEGDDLEDRIRRRIAAADEVGAEKADPIIGREVAERFQIFAKIGAGGMGAVYRAKQRNMDRDVAIKVLLRELAENETVVRRFHIEALAVSKLRHPNTIQIFDFGETPDGLLYIAMEYLEGKPLQRTLREEKQLSAQRSLRIALQIAKSLREAHSKGIIHRDLKPDNVVLETVGEDSDFVKVLDFGVAKLTEGDGEEKTLTKAGSIFGTPKYMSPEQSRGGDLDARSDIYSIGVLLYEMLCGRVPFDADNPLGILIKHIQEMPPAFQTMRPDLVVPENIEDFVFKLLEKDPANRPQTAEAVIRECEELLANLPELYRNVVTRADAEAMGIEITTSSRTVADTDLGSMRDTVGVFNDKTILGGQPSVIVRAPRSRWPLIAMGALVILLGTAGGLYASLDRLPAGYVDFTAVGSADIGTVPEFDVDKVSVTALTDPVGAEILNAAGEVVWSSNDALIVKRNKDAPSETYTARHAGYKDATFTLDFGHDHLVRVKLESTAPPVVARPVGERPTTITTDRPVTAIEKPATVVKPTVTAPVEYNPERVKDPKRNPYGAPKKLGGDKAKDSPY